MLMTTAIGRPYAAFDASFHELTKCMIRDLRIEIHHRGAYLLLRFFSETSRETAVSNLVDDENGDAVLFSLYMQEPEIVRKAESILKRGSVVILKEPYFKVGVGGSYMLRVDHPSDIIWLLEDDPQIPSKWRSSNPSLSKSADDWKKQGNAFVGKARFYDAIDMLVARFPTPCQQVF
jgi:hypothetical protein